MSMRPKRARHAATMAATSAASVTSQRCVTISAPASRARATVSAMASPSRSTANTCAPSCANSTAAARPLPQPGPTQPAPVMMATLSARRPGMVSVRLDAGGDDDVAPLVDLAPEIGGELVGAGGGEHRALARELLLHVRALHRLHRDAVEPGDDRR